MKPVTIGWIIFFGVPGTLWLLGAIVNRGQRSRAARVFAFMVGTDNRLSLSRLQAFLWSLVIFGSFASAMAIHKDIKPATTAEIDTATKKAKEAADTAAAKKTVYQSALAEAAATEAAGNAAHDAQVQAKAIADYWATAAAKENSLEVKNRMEQSKLKLQEAEAVSASKSASVPEKGYAASVAQGLYTRAEDASKKAQEDVPDPAWVQIPATLLALAGIAIGSGVFSSLISAVGDEQQTASITAIKKVSFGAAPNLTPLPQGKDVQPPDGHPDSLLICGSNFGLTKGTVRLYKGGFAKELAPVIYWHDDEIAIDLANGASYTKMTVDSPHGKLTCRLTGAHPNLQLGAQIVHYELVDLFRDDKNPDSLSLMKFQMFGWTVIALTIYIYLFLTHLSDHIQTLPTVDSSIAILTGVSQAGYLTGKGVSNLSSKP